MMRPYYFFSLLLFFVSGCASTATIADVIPVHDSFTIASKLLGENRVINVWTPTIYKTSKAPIQVLYMLDGGLKEDFLHVANTIAELISANKIPPIILVGIENTQRRRDLTGPTEVEADTKIAPVVGGSQKFRQFIKDELFAEVEKRYRTTNEKGIIGESLAGLFVVETLLKDPQMFDFYVAFDPSLWWNNHFLVKNSPELFQKFPTTAKRFWFAGSNTIDIVTYTEQFSAILTDQKLMNLKWQYSPEPNLQHNTIFRATKEKAIIWALNTK